MENFPQRKMVKAGDVSFAVYEKNGDPDSARPPIVLLHGWPEIAYSWRNQIEPLAQAGYRVIAIDLKGFGWSDAPASPEEYNVDQITAEYAALLDALNIERAIFCGHDWGGSLVWSMGQWRPERVAGVIGVCTPVKARPPVAPITILKKRFTEKHYFVQFQEIGPPEALFATDVERFVKLMFRKPAPRETWAKLVPDIFDLPGRFASDRPTPTKDLLVGEEILKIYIDAYTHSGFHGGINYYRNIDHNWTLMEGRDETVRAPSLWIGADLDLFLPPESADGMETLVPDLEKKIIENSGHWIMWEQPAALNTALTDWLHRRFA